MSGPVINRGEVWWADVPGDKIRPVLVVTEAALHFASDVAVGRAGDDNGPEYPH